MERNYNMETKQLKKYLLCIDGFGDMPLWSLQHPIKGTEDCYMIKIIDYTIPKEHDIIDELERLAKIFEMWFDIYITCTIEYDNHYTNKYGDDIKDFEYNIIHKIIIEKIEIENEKEIGQP
jgi:hypothetical protein